MSRDISGGIVYWSVALLFVVASLGAGPATGAPGPDAATDAVLAWEGPLEPAAEHAPDVQLEESASCGGTAPLVRACKNAIALDGVQAGFWVRLGIEFTGPVHAVWSTETGRVSFDCFYYGASLATCDRQASGLFYAGQLLVLEGAADLCCTPSAGFWQVGATVS